MPSAVSGLVSRPPAQQSRQVAAAWDSAVTALSAAAAGLRRLHGPRYGLGGFFSGSPRRQHRNGFMSRAVMGQAWPSG